MRRLAEDFESQFRALVAVNDATLNGDLRGSQQAIARLRRAAFRKVDSAEALADRYPELGRDLSQLTP
jgi:hypothetical protein